MRFDNYFEPTTLAECSSLLKEYGSASRLLAGGTDLVPRLKNRQLKISTVISLQGIPELSRIEKTENSMNIGAMVTLRDVVKSPLLTGSLKVVAEAAGHISSMQIRNIATIGGNSCNASPSADSVPGLLVSDAVAQISGVDGDRSVPLIDFFAGPGKTVLREGEILTGFSIPRTSTFTGATYEKYTIRGDTDITIVGAGCRLNLNKQGVIESARIALAAVAATPVRIDAVEKLLVGQKLTDELVKEAGNLAAANISPISDQRATASYRKEMVSVWVRHALVESQKRAVAAINKSNEPSSSSVEWTYYG